MTESLAQLQVDSPVGVLTLETSSTGLRTIYWGQKVANQIAATAQATKILSDTASQLDEYFAGQRAEFDLPLEPRGTEFQKSAWQTLRSIPHGETISYGEQATRMNKPKAVRAVGAANGANPIPIVVPCHRVIGANGSLTGFASGIDTKKWLLDHEADTLF